MVAFNTPPTGSAAPMENCSSCEQAVPEGGAPASTDESGTDLRGTRPRRRGLRSEAARQREAAIDQLVAEAMARGDCTDRFYWTLVYDLEMAPMTSNMKQLADLGVSVAPPDALDDRALQTKLWEIIETLGDLGVYLLNTDSLSDRELYSRLHGEILSEPVRDLPPTDGVSEFIDLGSDRAAHMPGESVPRKYDRDRFLPKPQA